MAEEMTELETIYCSLLKKQIFGAVRASDMNSPRVAIIILNWNGRDDTLACLASLKHLDYEENRSSLLTMVRPTTLLWLSLVTIPKPT